MEFNKRGRCGGRELFFERIFDGEIINIGLAQADTVSLSLHFWTALVGKAHGHLQPRRDMNNATGFRTIRGIFTKPSRSSARKFAWFSRNVLSCCCRRFRQRSSNRIRNQSENEWRGKISILIFQRFDVSRVKSPMLWTIKLILFLAQDASIVIAKNARWIDSLLRLMCSCDKDLSRSGLSCLKCLQTRNYTPRRHSGESSG